MPFQPVGEAYIPFIDVIGRVDCCEAMKLKEINVFSSIFFNFTLLGKKYIKKYNLTTS